jgi:hypothetical protein
VKAFLIGLLFVNFCAAASHNVRWYEGSVVLRNHQVLTGTVAIDAMHDLVLHKVEAQVNVYPAHKIMWLYYYDSVANINRRYMSWPVAGPVARAHSQLYEVVLQGDIMVLRRPRDTQTTAAIDGYHYYLKCQEGLMPLYAFKKKVYPTLQEETNGLLDAFRRENKLNPMEIADAVKLIEFYNQQVRAGNIMAKN